MCAAADGPSCAVNNGDCGPDATCDATGGVITCTPTTLRVFITSTMRQGDFGGVSVANADCQARADAIPALAGRPFLAWISDSTTSPSTTFTRGACPYKLVDDTQVASSYTALTSGADLDHQINVCEDGGDAVGIGAWTDVDPDGARTTSGEGGSDCSGWTTNSSGSSGGTGDSDSFSFPFWTVNSQTCDSFVRFYCFEQIRCPTGKSAVGGSTCV